MTKMISDETAVTAMYVYENLRQLQAEASADHPIHNWIAETGSVTMRYQSVEMAEQIDQVWANFSHDELDGVYFEADFVPNMVALMDFDTAGIDEAPKFKDGIEAAISHVKEDIGLIGAQLNL